jgi:catechol 2,3-dioxygenase-like lactoylglutathione lyase family enzyme
VANFVRITPFMHVPDVDGAVAFFRDLLGFKVWIHRRDYAYVQREVAGVRILKASESPGEEVPPGNRRFMYYIDVEDVACGGRR